MLRSTAGRLGWVLATIVLISACSGTATPGGATSTPGASKTARIGSFDRPIIFAFTPSQDVARITASGNAMASALATATGLKFKVTIPTSYAAQIEAMCAGQADLAAIAPLQMTLLLDKSCGTPILAALRKDDTGALATTYKSQILVRSDSGITDLNGLKGNKFAFVDPISASGYLFPTLLIKNKTGQDPKTFFGSTIFAGGHDKAALAVYQGTVDGAASFIDVRTSAGMPADIMAKTKVIDTAGPIPNDGVAVAKSIPQDIVDQITTALIAYCSAAPGQATCLSLFSWNGLQKVTSDFYNPVRDAAKLAGIDVAAEAAKTPAPPPPTPSPSPTKAP
ncbi:MAG TPA: phosphate/phosphite/phosphonate ABC transporter substrate-binding protein [Candidatus Saccharimonadales bacterium]|nr:phosphate/phosphite/phosphonate ABC transporter substrate-binding protein [Candidatus Saccharimonadales bacterium]